MRHFTKFWLYKYLESEHSAIEKALLKTFCWLVFRLLRLPNSLWQVFVAEIINSDFKLVIRRLQWLVSHSALKLELVKDRYFDFSIGLSTDAAKEMYTRIDIKVIPERFEKEIILAQLSSAVLESKVLPGEELYVDQEEDHYFDALFVKHLSNALKIANETKPLKSRLDEPVTKSNVDKKVDLKKNSNENSGESQNLKRNRFRENALEVYFDLLDLLEDLECPIFALSGTMLGIIREGDFLSHDYDIDIGIMESGLEMEVLKNSINKSNNYFIKKCDYPAYRCMHEAGVKYARRETPTLIKVGHKKGIHTDIFVHIQEGDACWHGSSLHGWVNTPFELVHVEFFNRNVLVPKNYDLYLTENYGDWKTPVSDFNCSTGTPNISVTNSCKSLCYMVKMKHDYRKLDLPNQAKDIENKMLESGLFTMSEEGELLFNNHLPTNGEMRNQNFTI